MVCQLPETTLGAAWQAVVPSVCAPPGTATAVTLPDARMQARGPSLRAMDTDSSTTSLVRPKGGASLFARPSSASQV